METFIGTTILGRESKLQVTPFGIEIYAHGNWNSFALSQEVADDLRYALKLGIPDQLVEDVKEGISEGYNPFAGDEALTLQNVTSPVTYCAPVEDASTLVDSLISTYNRIHANLNCDIEDKDTVALNLLLLSQDAA